MEGLDQLLLATQVSEHLGDLFAHQKRIEKAVQAALGWVISILEGQLSPSGHPHQLGDVILIALGDMHAHQDMPQEREVVGLHDSPESLHARLDSAYQFPQLRLRDLVVLRIDSHGVCHFRRWGRFVPFSS